MVASALAAEQQPRRHGVQVARGSIVAGFVANGIFHIETAVRFRERSPGLVTALLLMIPGGATILRDLSRRGQLDRRDIVTAVLGGVLLNAAAVASLRLDMPTLQRARVVELVILLSRPACDSVNGPTDGKWTYAKSR